MRIASLLLCAACTAACSDWPSTPTGLPGYSLQILDVRRSSPGSTLLRVRVRYELSEPLKSPLVYMCGGRDTESIVKSTCGYRAAFAQSAEIEVEAGTAPSLGIRYLHGFITSGSLGSGPLHQIHVDIDDDLTRRIAAHTILPLAELSLP
jgi:hypothetical protein